MLCRKYFMRKRTDFVLKWPTVNSSGMCTRSSRNGESCTKKWGRYNRFSTRRWSKISKQSQSERTDSRAAFHYYFCLLMFCLQGAASRSWPSWSDGNNNLYARSTGKNRSKRSAGNHGMFFVNLFETNFYPVYGTFQHCLTSYLQNLLNNAICISHFAMVSEWNLQKVEVNISANYTLAFIPGDQSLLPTERHGAEIQGRTCIPSHQGRRRQRLEWGK